MTSGFQQVFSKARLTGAALAIWFAVAGVCAAQPRAGVVRGAAELALFYVDQRNPQGSDGNPGTSPDLPWKTIAKANATLTAGKTVVVGAGTYEEEIAPSSSGAEGAPITYVGRGGDAKPIIRHVGLLRKQYIRVIGFEITQNSKQYRHGIEVYASHHCEILNNYIHHTLGQAIRNNAYYGTSDYNVIRGNVIAWTGYPQGLTGEARGHNAINLLCNHTLIEYNDISHVLDFVNTNGAFNIIRNNYFHDFKNSDFPDGGGDKAHVDIWQPYGVPGKPSDHNVFEYNWASDNLELNSHFNQIRDETRPRSGEKEFVIRGNVVLRMGSYACQFGAIDNVHFYNNTLVDLCVARLERKSWVTIGFNTEGDNPSVGNYVLNTIFYAVCRPKVGRIISVGEGCQAKLSNNACEKSGGHASCVVTANINFADYPRDVLYLAENSHAIDAGRPLSVVTSAAGNGRSFTVEEAGFFIDGHNLVLGDLIRVGADAVTRVVKVDHGTNTLTVSPPITWRQGDSVVLAYQDARPDIGAFEFSSDYSYDVTLAPTAATDLGTRQITANVAQPENVRFVTFYVDNLPVGTDATAPFTCNWMPTSRGAEYHLTATAYSRFASRRPTKSVSAIYMCPGE
jgi:hypothetical protein